MPAFLERIIGVVLTLVAGIGLIVNIAALVFLPGLEATIQAQLANTVTVLNSTLVTTTQGMDVVTLSLDNAQDTLGAVEGTTRSVGVTLADTIPAVGAVSDLAENSLPDTIAGTREAMQVAADSAAGIDVVLAALADVNILGAGLGITYDPETSLAASLNRVNESLEPLESSFDEIATSLSTAEGNLQEVNVQITGVADSLAQFDSTVDQAKDVTAQYKNVIVQQQQVLQTVETQVLPGVRYGLWAIMALLGWLAVAQLGLLAQGLEMIGRSGRRMANKPVGDLE